MTADPATRRRPLLQLLRDQRGVTAIMFALMAPMLIGFAALGVETGLWYTVKRQNQSAADVAALSGALELAAGGTSAQAIAAAKADAKKNGFDFAATGNTASVVNNPYVDGSGVSHTNAVEVILKHEQAPLLAKLFLGSDFTIKTRAVASISTTSSCASGVGGTGSDIIMKGGASISMPGCTLTAASTDSAAFDLRGGATITAYSIYTSGSCSPSCTSSSFILTVPATTGAPKLTDPYASVTIPTMPTMPTMPPSVTTAPSPIPGTFSSSFSLSAPSGPGSKTRPASCPAATTISVTGNMTPPQTCYPGAVTISPAATCSSPCKLTFSNNTDYWFGGAVTISSGVNVVFAGGNKTFYVNAGDLSITVGSSNTVTFSAGTYDIFAGKIVTGGTGTVTFNTGGTYSINDGSGAFTIGGPASLQSATYRFYGSGGVAISSGGSAVTVGSAGTANSLYVDAGNFTITGSNVSFNPGDYSANAGAFSVGSGGNATLNAGTYRINDAGSAFGVTGTVNFAATGTYQFYGNGITVNSGGTASFGASTSSSTYYYLGAGTLTVNGTATFGAGTATIDIAGDNQGLTSGSGSTVTFTGSSGANCSTSNHDTADSNYYFNAGRSSKPGTFTFGGTTNFGAGCYYFYAGNGVAISGGTASFGAGAYSLQNGNLSIASGATASFAAGTSYIYAASGSFSNSGTASIGAGTVYLYQPSGSFTNSGTLCFGTISGGTCTPSGSGTYYVSDNSSFTNSGTATFGSGTYQFSSGSGGFSSTGTIKFAGGSSSNYYFYNGSSSGALNIGAAGIANFGPATYYVINGDLVFDSGATLGCPGCAIGGAGDTFVLTETASGGSIGTIQVQNPITATLSAPGSGTYKGLLVFQDRAAPLATFAGGSTTCKTNCNTLDGGDNMDLTGAIYLPQGAVDFKGGKSSGNCLVIIADVITFTGSSTLTSSGCASDGVSTISVSTVALIL